MTIIEATIEKAKALRGGRPDGHGATGSASSAGQVQYRRSSDVSPPSTQIVGHRVAFNPELARENRLLLAASSKEDRGTIAAYGMLRTRLLHRARSKGWQSIGITSAAPQDGKSLTAVNLALSLAREKNSSVVLLDLDMRNPSICRTLGIVPRLELRHFFDRRIESPDDLFMSIGIDNLLIAGNEGATENSAELLASSRLEELLNFIKRSTVNPLILIDLPPVLSPDDTLVVAPRVDAMVLVASEGITPRADLTKAGELLAEYPIAGLVLNHSTEFGQKYGYGYGYGGDSSRA